MTTPIKEIIMQVRASPSVKGWNDTVLVIVDNHLVYACPARSGPNWSTPAGRPWWEKYDCIAPGTYRWQFMANHHRYGDCLLINEGGEVQSRNPMPNANGSIFTEVFFHAASTESWPGSAGCQTIPLDFWDGFIAMFRFGDTGALGVIDTVEWSRGVEP